jgi:S-DNA-T family DNA segregation ATPase FtsK/SpoIIIE
VLFLRRHAIVGGATGSGKSDGLNELLANLAACGDVVIWAIDLKPGHDTRRRARAYLVTDDDVTDTVARYAATRPRLDSASRLALAGGTLSPAPQPSSTPSPGHRAARPDDADPDNTLAADSSKTRTRSCGARCPPHQPKAFPSATSSRLPE